MKTADKPAAPSAAAQLMQLSQLALRDAQALARYAGRIFSGNNLGKLVGDLRRYGKTQDQCGNAEVRTIMEEIESQLGDSRKRRLAKIRSERQARDLRFRLEHEQREKEQWDEDGELWCLAIENAETHAAALTEAVALMRAGYGTPSFAKAVYDAAPHWPFSGRVDERQRVKARREQKHETPQDRETAVEAASNVVPFESGNGRSAGELSDERINQVVDAEFRRAVARHEDDRPDAG